MSDELDDRETLASAYVLGTLSASERADAEQRIAADAGFAALVAAWETRLAPLVEAVTPAAPPPFVWDEVARATRSVPSALRIGQLRTLLPAHWRPLAAVLAVAAAVLVLVWGGLGERQLRWARFSPDAGAQQQWVMTIAARGSTVSARPGDSQALVAALAGRTAQLWLIVGQNPPQSLGLLDPRESRALHLPPPAGVREAVLAVSLEPPGGSPTGLPTGPVVFTGKLAAL